MIILNDEMFWLSHKMDAKEKTKTVNENFVISFFHLPYP